MNRYVNAAHGVLLGFSLIPVHQRVLLVLMDNRQNLEQQFAWTVSQVGTIMTWTHPLRVYTVHQGPIPAYISLHFVNSALSIQFLPSIVPIACSQRVRAMLATVDGLTRIVT